MISCEEALEQISLELDGLLDEAGRGALEAHLAQCASCRALARDLSALHRALPGLEAAPPEGFAGQILERAKPAPLWRRPQLRRLAGLAACALLCAGLYQLRPVEQGNTSAAPAAQPQMETELAGGRDGAAGGEAGAQMEPAAAEPPLQSRQNGAPDGEAAEQAGRESACVYASVQPEEDCAKAGGSPPGGGKGFPPAPLARRDILRQWGRA